MTRYRKNTILAILVCLAIGFCFSIGALKAALLIGLCAIILTLASIDDTLEDIFKNQK